MAHDLDAYRDRVQMGSGPDCTLVAAMRPVPPDCDSAENLAAKLRAARAAGVDRVDFYHYGMAPRIAGTLRVVMGSRASLDVAGRYLALGRIAERNSGRDSISRVESAFTWRLTGRQAIGVQYAWSHRSATFASGNERGQTLAQIGLFYTLLGSDGFGTVDWRAAR